MTIKTEAFGTLTPDRLARISRGIEKESLRTLPQGALSMTPHPQALGSALKHPHITTDFCESQVELITGVHTGVQSCLDELARLQHFTSKALGDDMLWVSSMPCGLPDDDAIPIGQYGTSNVGRAKTVYRTGLGYRYGRRMQTISGIHYNWSFPDVSSEQYFALIRNFRRRAFLLLYLFGATPAVCSTFVAGRNHQLQSLNGKAMYLPYATSLRMGRLGYQSDAQSSLAVSYNDLEGYGHSLEEAMTRSYAPYEAIGVRGPDGSYRQLATSLLQIENEFYGTIRPKRTIFAGERPLHALRERGVEYVEVRLMDLDPFEVQGISARTMRFLDIFLLHCLTTPSANDTPEENAALARNQHAVAERGREPGLQLERNGEQVTLTEWGRELTHGMLHIAQALDVAHGCDDYSQALTAAQHALDYPQTLPSARVLQAISQEHDSSFLSFVRTQSVKLKAAMLATPMDADTLARMEQESAQSWISQRHTEESDSMPFDIYLQEYLSPRRLLAGLGR